MEDKKEFIDNEEFNFEERNSERNILGGGMCDRNPKHEHFNKVVATWQTIRHYDVRSFDTIRPICTNGLSERSFESLMNNTCENKCRGCRCNFNDR